MVGVLVGANAFAAPRIVALVTARPTTLNVGECRHTTTGELCAVTWINGGHRYQTELGSLDPHTTVDGWATSGTATASRSDWYFVPCLVCGLDGAAVNGLWAALILLNRRRRHLPDTFAATALTDPDRSGTSQAGLMVAPALLSIAGLVVGVVAGTQIVETVYRAEQLPLASRLGVAIGFPLAGILLNGLVMLRILRLRKGWREAA
jgi:hypothetical protein